MAWNGSGTYSRPVTTVSPATGGTTIDVADQNTYTADVAAGVNACLAKNGENAATGDINLGSNQLKALADGTLATDGVNVGQVQGGSFVYEGTVGGTANDITLTLSPTLTAYAEGQVFRFLANSANTGTVTINVDGLGAKAVRTQRISALEAGEIGANGIYEVVYDGSRFIIQATANIERNDVGFSAKDCSLSPATNTWTQIIFDVESRDPGSNYAASAYTCPTDGVYQFNAAVSYSTMQADSGPTDIAIYVDGSRYRSVAGAFNASAGVERVDTQISISDAFSAGEVITVWTRHQGAATEAIDDALDQVWFNGHRITLID